MEAKRVNRGFTIYGDTRNFPNVPVIVLTGMKVEAPNNATDQQNLFNAHELLKAGLTDFTHISTTNSGHYIL